MDTNKSIYGKEKLDIYDLIESHMEHLVELTYYKIKNANQYSVEIELDNGNIKESERINLLTDNEVKTNKVLDILMRNKVTPIGLEDTVTEIVKMKLV